MELQASTGVSTELTHTKLDSQVWYNFHKSKSIKGDLKLGDSLVQIAFADDGRCYPISSADGALRSLIGANLMDARQTFQGDPKVCELCEAF